MRTAVKTLIWVYLVLLIFEGSLRKWIAPSLADPLLIIRDPVAVLIYILAIVGGFFPINGFVIATGALAAVSAVMSLLAGQDNLVVLAYGLRINYLHVPLIWVIGEVLTRKDVERLGSFLLIIALPMTALMVQQFRSPMDAWVNRGVGGDEVGQIFGAEGRIRPPGFFAFITGPQLFLPLAAAFFLNQVSMRRRLWLPVLIASGLAIIIACPVSISRTAMLATCVVGLFFVFSLPFSGSSGARAMMRTFLIVGVVVAALSQLPIFSEGTRVFMVRWEQASVSTDGDAWGGVIGRVLAGFTQPFHWAAAAPFFGEGVGVGSNVGARLLSGKVGFLLAEDEWGKVFMELGPVLGFAFIFFRLAITANLGYQALLALRHRRDNLPLLIWSAIAVAIAQLQWAPPTILGFAVLGGGFVLAALKEDEEEEEETDDAAEAESEEDFVPDETFEIPEEPEEPQAPPDPDPAPKPPRDPYRGGRRPSWSGPVSTLPSPGDS